MIPEDVSCLFNSHVSHKNTKYNLVAKSIDSSATTFSPPEELLVLAADHIYIAVLVFPRPAGAQLLGRRQARMDIDQQQTIAGSIFLKTLT
jgi:hypothetical protein